MTGSTTITRHIGRRLALPLFSALVAIGIAASPTAAVTGWTGPGLVGTAANCFDTSAVIDASGRYHVVADCNGGIRYSVSSASGTWTTVRFDHPLDQQHLQPQIALDGSTLYVGYTSEDFGTCGFAWNTVYVRHRTLPSGAWSAAVVIGKRGAGDHLQSMRVVGGRIHATIDNGGKVYYETWLAGIYHQYLLSDAVGLTSLRVGSDGHARIAYEGASSLRYAVWNGTTFAKSTIPGTSADDRKPLLVLDGTNHAHVVWSHEAGPGCGDGTMSSKDGTYYATNIGGAWTTPAARRFTTAIGAASLTLDTATGRIHVLLGTEHGLWYYTRAGSGSWTNIKLSSAASWSTSIRLNQATGRLLAVYVRAADENISSSVYAFTKP